MSVEVDWRERVPDCFVDDSPETLWCGFRTVVATPLQIDSPRKRLQIAAGNGHPSTSSEWPMPGWRISMQRCENY